MKRLALVALLSLFAAAPTRLAQGDAQRLGRDPVQTPAEQAGVSGGNATPAKEAPGTAAKRDCTRCERAYHVPTRWHRLLPGMFR